MSIHNLYKIDFEQIKKKHFNLQVNKNKNLTNCFIYNSIDYIQLE